ncbi:hypothetical protein [Palleronia caenipelagi]|uniref:Uncharacterized protein n=1 Tax=Palleronia caenipelagi TaxID=2489174 RepID=A0A547Q344_9RHOB|nr:hypothetical protein [Palleronia caenipelagi]TRD20814.1 hypothetical protein FEV53_09315 [Palleronia caenipelagi]
MTETIFLEFTETEIRLLRQTGASNRVLAELPVDDEGLSARLNALRGQLEAELGIPLRADILVPPSEMLVLDVRCKSTDPAAMEAAAKESLAGRTPYALDELAFDVQRIGEDRIAVAAVARETLDELDSFAKTHGFGPGRFRSHRKTGLFPRMADFGISPRAKPETAKKAPKITGIRVATAAATGQSVATPVQPVPSVAPSPKPAAKSKPTPAAAAAPKAAPAAAKPPLRAPQKQVATAVSALRTPPALSKTNALAAAGVLAVALLGGALWLLGADDAPVASLPAEPTPQVAETTAPEAEPPSDQVADDTPSPAAPVETETADIAEIVAPAEPIAVSEKVEQEQSDIAFAAPEPADTAPSAPPEVIAAAPELEPRARPTASDADAPVVEGEIAADPVEVIASAPDIVPPARPGFDTPTSDAALTRPGDEDLRPRARPETPVVAEDPTEVTEAATPETPLTVDQPIEEDGAAAALAKLRPAARPFGDEERTNDADLPDTADAASDDLTAPNRPDADATRPAPRPEAVAEAQSSAVATDEALPSVLGDRDDPRSGLRPSPRPADRIKTLLEQAELQELQDQKISDLVQASLNPRARPEGLRPEPTQPALAPGQDAAGVAATLASLAREVPQPERISPYAISRSPVPKTRPRNLKKTVRRAEPEAKNVRVASASAVVRPSGPTSGSVAARATTKNVLPLGNVNLIGVYGSSSNRRALVRLPSGKFVKVKIGDRVDGGRVRAISASSLDYVKSGRTVRLSMPK